MFSLPEADTRSLSDVQRRIRHGDDVDYTLPVTEPGGWSDYGNRHTQNISLSRADRRTRGASKLAYILIALCVLVFGSWLCLLWMYSALPGTSATEPTGEHILSDDVIQELYNDVTTDESRGRVVKALLEASPLIDGQNKFLMTLLYNTNGELRLVDLNEPISSQLTLPVGGKIQHIGSQTDLLDLKTGNVGAQVLSISVDCRTQNRDAVESTMKAIDLLNNIASRYDQYVDVATSYKDLIDNHRAKKLSAILHLDGGHTLADSLAVLRGYYRLGVRSAALTSYCHTNWAESHVQDSDSIIEGLSEFGQYVVNEMNRLGMIIDLSGTSERTAMEILERSTAPVVYSHAGVRAVYDHPRNVPDNILHSLKNNGGIIMVTFDAQYLKKHSINEELTLHNVIEHLDYVKNLVGVDHVGLGSNFDGFPRGPSGIDNTSKFPNLLKELLKVGWTPADVQKLAGGNFLRVFRKVEEVKESLLTESANEQTVDLETQLTEEQKKCKTFHWVYEH